MRTYLTFINALFFALDVSAQARASVSASVTIVDLAGTSFSNNGLANDSISSIASTDEGMKIVHVDNTAELGKLSFLGVPTAYSITLPAEPILLSRISGNEILTIQSLQVVTAKNDENSLHIIAICLPGKVQAAGFYSSAAPIDIVIDYN